jgi:uncharacterized protein (TIGR00725 family)
MKRKSAIAIVGSGKELEPAISNARELGRLVAEQGWILVTGGRNAGVMRAAAEGASEAKQGVTVGILPDSETEIAGAVDIAIVTGTGEARNNIIVLSADVVIACDVADAGTASEVSLALKNGKQVVLLGVNAEASYFFGLIGGRQIHVVDSPVRAVELVKRLLSAG